MKKKLLLPALAGALLLGSCSKDAPEVSSAPEATTAESQAVGDVQLFAEALSKALAEEPELRSLIKRQALKRFDNNTDALYQHFKGLKTSEGTTIREIIQKYWAGTEASFRSFEAHAPLLNVHLPDLSLFEQASAQEWDAQSKEVAVALVREGLPYTPLYLAGDSVDRIEKGEIPAIPTLVINQNNRVKVASSFRSLGGEAEFSYDFVHPSFDGTKSGQSARNAFVYEEPATPNELSEKELDEVTNGLWKRISRNRPELQRASIYYPNDTDLDRTVNEQLLRFKLSVAGYEQVSDDRHNQEGADPYIDRDKFHLTTRGRDASIDEVINTCWTRGVFTFVFEVHTPMRTGSSEVNSFPISVYPKQLYVMNPDRWRKHPTMFRHTKYHYRIYPERLEPRWVYPARINNTNPMRISGSWNLAEQGLLRRIFIKELDEKGENVEKQTLSSQFVTGANAEASLSVSQVISSLKLGGSMSYTTTKTMEISVTRQKGSDELGVVDLHFYDPVIYKLDKSGYTPYDIVAGNMTITIVPMKSGIY